MRTILHLDFDSYFASVEQQANPHLRGKPIGVTGGDRMTRTIISTASKEAKKRGVKPPIQIWEAKRICPDLILVPGDSDKYLSTTKKFLNILKDYSPLLEVFSIDEAFLEVSCLTGPAAAAIPCSRGTNVLRPNTRDWDRSVSVGTSKTLPPPLAIALEIKKRIRQEIGEFVTVSVGISYNKVMAKLASSYKKPDGLFVIPDEKTAIEVLDTIPLDDLCGIGGRIKKRLLSMGIHNFKQLRSVPLEYLTASFKSYGVFLYEIARGRNSASVVPFYEKEEVKSVGHRHTLNHDTKDELEIKQILLKITELIGRRLRAKRLVGKTIVCYFRYAKSTGIDHFFLSDGMQITVSYTDDGLEIFKGAWKIFQNLWSGEPIRLVGATVSNLKSILPETISLLEEEQRRRKIVKTLDFVNDRFGEFTLQRGVLLKSAKVYRKANPFLADRRFKV